MTFFSKMFQNRLSYPTTVFHQSNKKKERGENKDSIINESMTFWSVGSSLIFS